VAGEKCGDVVAADLELMALERRQERPGIEVVVDLADLGAEMGSGAPIGDSFIQAA
jgi:hypothetical protein